MKSNLSCLSFQNVNFDVVDQQGQPWLRSQQISVALGYSRGDQVNDLYERNADEFTEAMTALVKLPDLQQGNSGTGQMREVRIFSLRGCHLLGMFARTDPAKEFRKWVLDVLDHQAITLPITPAIPVIESSLVLDFQGVPIRFLIDAHGEWMATYADVATALGYVNKEQQYNARNILKYTVKAIQRQLRHPLYGDLINLAGMERVLAQLARNAACMPEPASLAVNLKEWLDKTAKSLINQPVSAGRLLEAPQARALEMTPIDWEFTQAVQVFECWFAVLGDVVLTTRQVIDRAAGTPLAGLLLDIAEGRRSPGVVSSLRLGIWLARRVGWNFNGWVLPPVITRKNDVKRWTLRKVAP